MLSFRSRKDISVVLVDDEEIAIHRLRKSLAAYPFVKILGEADNGISAVEMINRLRPELVFLDIQMPGFNGFEVFHHLHYMPLVVFVTAYEEFAVKAFEKNSLDYLLKPVEEDRLAITMNRIIEKGAVDEEMLTKLRQLINNNHSQHTITTIPVKLGNRIRLIPVSDVCVFEARDKYVYIHTLTEESLIDYPLNYLQDRLPPEFLRIHRGFIINKLKIKEIHKYFKGTFLILMEDRKGSKIKTAYSYSETIRATLLMP